LDTHDDWTRDSLDFTAGATGNVNLTFTNTDFNSSFNQDGGIDNIVVTAVPEPSSTALLGLALILRRRK